jgi:hypothetical protein
MNQVIEYCQRNILQPIRTKLTSLSIVQENQEFVNDFENATQIKLEYIAVIMLLLFTVSLNTNIGVGFATDFIGFAYPTYATFKVINCSVNFFLLIFLML